jgi:hypothetical protein
MTTLVRPTLLSGLALAAEAVGPGTNDVTAADDPLRLDLPALGPSAGELPSSSTVRVLAGLYLASELEQAGVVPIAELLAEQRYTLNLSSYESAAKLEDFATRMRAWYDRAGRIQIYARLFGSGPAATNDAGVLVNREFVPQLAALCHALARYTDTMNAGGPGVGLEASVRLTAQALLGNVAQRALGNTLLAARRLEDEVRHAVDVLRDPAISMLVGARTLQQTIVNILGKDAPDVQRLIDTGLTGQKVIDWLSRALPRVEEKTQSGPIMTFGDPIAVTAALWLHAAGLDQPQQVAA